MILGGSLAIVTILMCLSRSESQKLPSLCCTTADGINYKINNTFITLDCMSKCVCTHDAYLACVPFCPNTPEQCPPGYVAQESMVLSGAVDSRTIFLYPGAKDKKCYCKRVTCIFAGRQQNAIQYCYEGLKSYKPGEEFARGCTKRCRCGNNGIAQCSRTCPPEKPCPLGFSQKNVTVPVKVNQAKCQCKAKACKPLQVKDECNVNGKLYKSGDKFISADCSGSCQCLPGGIVSCSNLCSPLGAAVSCNIDENAVQVQESVPNSKCTCPKWKCVKSTGIRPVVVVGTVHNNAQNPSPDQCQVGSRNYNPGDTFVKTDCTQKCTCMPGNTLSCHALCLPDGTTCAHDQNKVQYFVNVPNSNCRCRKYRCESNQG